MKTLVVHEAGRAGAVRLDKGEYSVDQLDNKKVLLKDVAQMVACGRAEWSHNAPAEKPVVKASATKKQALDDE